MAKKPKKPTKSKKKLILGGAVIVNSGNAQEQGGKVFPLKKKPKKKGKAE